MTLLYVHKNYHVKKGACSYNVSMCNNIIDGLRKLLVFVLPKSNCYIPKPVVPDSSFVGEICNPNTYSRMHDFYI